MKEKISKWFSFPIFKESFKSNFLSFVCVGIGNALIAFVVILILSTLSLNATKQSMQNMFNTAKMEHTLKQGSVGAYIAFKEGINAYENVIPEAENYLLTAYDGLNISVDILNGDYNLALIGVQTMFTINYATASGETDEEKYQNAKDSTLERVKNRSEFFQLGYTDLVQEFCSNFIDISFQNQSEDLSTRVEKSVYFTVENYAKSQLNLNDLEVAYIKSLISSTAEEVNKDENNKNEIIKDNIIDAVNLIIPSEYSSLLNEFLPQVLDAYIENGDDFKNNVVNEGETLGQKDKLYLSLINEFAKNLLEENLYYDYLPDFEVEYLTNELGEPYYYKEVNIDGNVEKVEEVIDTIEERQYLIPVKENMGLYSNMLEKMHKEMITGTGYSEEEIKLAKEEASKYVNDALPLLNGFFEEYIANKDAYFDFTSMQTKDDAITKKVGSIIKEYSKELIPEFFNVETIDDINKETIGLDGNELANKAYDYSISSIAIYESEKESELNEGRSTTDAMLIALNRASTSLLDELPADISFKLDDLTSRNLYGLVVGVILFSIAGLLLPIVYSILTANGLVAQQVESGSLAFTLSSPISRKSIILSKALYLVFSIFSMYLLLFLFSLMAREIGIAMGGTDFYESLTIFDLFRYALGSFLVSLAISGICFLSSCIFNKTKFAIGVGGGISIFFLVSSILGLFGSEVMPLALRIDSMNFFNYLTIIKLFDVQSILVGTNTYYYLLIPLVVISVVTYLTGCVIFSKKDLPI